jgi:hypothetical protein
MKESILLSPNIIGAQQDIIFNQMVNQRMVKVTYLLYLLRLDVKRVKKIDFARTTTDDGLIVTYDNLTGYYENPAQNVIRIINSKKFDGFKDSIGYKDFDLLLYLRHRATSRLIKEIPMTTQFNRGGGLHVYPSDPKLSKIPLKHGYLCNKYKKYLLQLPNQMENTDIYVVSLSKTSFGNLRLFKIINGYVVHPNDNRIITFQKNE